jgi:hypothetical protein
MKSRLLSLIALGINEEGSDELAEIIKKNRDLSVPELNRHWEEAMPLMFKNKRQINLAVTDLLYDRDFCKKAEIDYSDISMHPSYYETHVKLAISQHLLLQTCQETN